MEPLWSPVVATGGNRSQIASGSEGPNQAKTVAIGCDQLPRRAHGKERVCHRLPPVAEVPLSVKEGSTLSRGLPRATSCVCRCIPGMGSARNHSRCMLRGPWLDCSCFGRGVAARGNGRSAAATWHQPVWYSRACTYVASGDLFLGVRRRESRGCSVRPHAKSTPARDELDGDQRASGESTCATITTYPSGSESRISSRGPGVPSPISPTLIPSATNCSRSAPRLLEYR
jgi:hypothetical protein